MSDFHFEDTNVATLKNLTDLQAAALVSADSYEVREEVKKLIVEELCQKERDIQEAYRAQAVSLLKRKKNAGRMCPHREVPLKDFLKGTQNEKGEVL